MRSDRVNRRAAQRIVSRCLLLAAVVPVCGHAQPSGVPEATSGAAYSSVPNQFSRAPEATTGRTFSIVPTFSITETFTDNRDLTSTNRQSDLITQVSPGLRMTSTGGRF